MELPKNGGAKLLPDISSKYEQDMLRLIQVFPEELWLLVFDKIKDPTCLIKVAKASLCFQQFLKPRRVQYLLPQILQILAPSLGFALPHRMSAYHYDNSLLRRSEQKQPPFWYTTLTEMRRVCRSWKQTVDHYFASHRLHNKPASYYLGSQEDSRENPHNFAELMECYTFRFTDVDKPNQFLNHFQSSHEDFAICNPFLGRAIRLDDEQCPSWQIGMRRLNSEQALERSKQLRNGFTRVITNYGNHVRYCCISFWEMYCTNDYQLDYVNKIWQWLKLMPSLQVLGVSAHNIYRLRRDDNLQSNENQILEELEAMLAKNPFPKLVNLQCLSTSGLPKLVLNNLLANNRHLTRVGMCVNKFQEFDQLKHFTSLQELSLRFCQAEHVEKLDAIAPHLGNLKGLHLQFNGLTMELTSNDKHWLRYMEVVCKHWGQSSTLEDLTLQSPKDDELMNEFLEQIRTQHLGLPPVKRFKLVLCSPCSMEFFGFCRDSVETLQLLQFFENLPSEVHPIWYKTAAGDRAWLELDCTLGVSNIFDYFPKLQRVYLSRRIGPPHRFEYSKQGKRVLE